MQCSYRAQRCLSSSMITPWSSSESTTAPIATARRWIVDAPLGGSCAACIGKLACSTCSTGTITLIGFGVYQRGLWLGSEVYTTLSHVASITRVLRGSLPHVEQQAHVGVAHETAQRRRRLGHPALVRELPDMRARLPGVVLCKSGGHPSIPALAHKRAVAALCRHAKVLWQLGRGEGDLLARGRH